MWMSFFFFCASFDYTFDHIFYKTQNSLYGCRLTSKRLIFFFFWFVLLFYLWSRWIFHQSCLWWRLFCILDTKFWLQLCALKQHNLVRTLAPFLSSGIKATCFVILIARLEPHCIYMSLLIKFIEQFKSDPKEFP